MMQTQTNTQVGSDAYKVGPRQLFFCSGSHVTCELSVLLGCQLPKL